MKKMHRFICEFREEDGHVVIESSNVVRQIQTIVRLSVGEKIAVLDGLGKTVQLELTDVEDAVRGRVIHTSMHEGELDVSVTMYVAILKRDLFELVIEKLTELGVKEIVPITTDRTIKLGLRHDRLLSIARETTELSGRSVIPTIHEPISFDAVFKGRQDQVMHIFFDQGEKNVSSLSFAKEQGRAGWVGPEGGWSEREQTMIKESKCILASLTETTLRGETAAILGSYVLSR